MAIKIKQTNLHVADFELVPMYLLGFLAHNIRPPDRRKVLLERYIQNIVAVFINIAYGLLLSKYMREK
jgi:hypothetical protein